jgi:hypothetical protein
MAAVRTANAASLSTSIADAASLHQSHRLSMHPVETTAPALTAANDRLLRNSLLSKTNGANSDQLVDLLQREQAERQSVKAGVCRRTCVMSLGRP